ncbi:hypothetical protein ONS96_013400 [Cadophora gregata f. sp. sojae]|nr:hypothetical protein ONS96_013400 [Cadophora gregata f. sp. sojae]
MSRTMADQWHLDISRARPISLHPPRGPEEIEEEVIRLSGLDFPEVFLVDWVYLSQPGVMKPLEEAGRAYPEQEAKYSFFEAFGNSDA